MIAGILQIVFLAVVLPVLLSVGAANIVFKFVDYFNYRMRLTKESMELTSDISSMVETGTIISEKKPSCQQVA